MRRTILVAALIFLCASVVRAQVAFYVTSTSGHFSNVQTGAGRTTDFWASGIGAGATFNFIPIGPLNIGFDLRGSTRPGTAGADTGLGGIRVAFNTPGYHIKPYLQASGGYVGTRTISSSNGGTFTNRYAAWEILGGIDVPLARFIDLRAIEFGGGTGYDIRNIGSPNPSLFTLNTGIVAHF